MRVRRQARGGSAAHSRAIRGPVSTACIWCFIAGQDASRKARRVDGVEAGPVDAEPGAGGLQEPQIERGVVRDEHAVTGELEECRQHRVDAGRGRDHAVGDAGEDRDEGRDRLAWVDQRVQLTEHLAAAHLYRTDLGDARGGWRAAGGLEVDDHEGDLAQRDAQFVEGALDRN